MKRVLILLLLLAGLPAAAASSGNSEDLVAGMAALEDGFYQVAAQRLERYVEAEEDRDKKANAALLLLRAWYGRAEYARMIDWIEANGRVAQASGYKPGFIYWHAQANYALGQHREAADELKKFDRRYPESEFAPYALRLLALSLRDDGQLDRAEETFVLFSERYPDHRETPDNLLDWAGLLIQRGDVEDAEALLERLVADYEGTDPARYARLWLGQAAQERRAPKQAADWLTPLTEDAGAPDALRADAWFALARTDVDRDRITNAIAALVQAEQITTNVDRRVAARIDRARLLMDAGRLKAAVEVMNETVFTLASHPQAARAQRELADLLRAQGAYEDAADAYQRYLESFSDEEGTRHALAGRAWCLWELGRYPEAARAFEKAYAAAVDPARREEALIKAADSYFSNGQFKLAAETYRKVIGGFPESGSVPVMMYQVAESQARAGDVTNAIASLTRVWKGYAEQDIGATALLRLARYYEELQEWDSSIGTYDEFLETYGGTPREAEAMLERSLLQYRLGEYGTALEGFEALLAAHPETEEGEKAFFMRGWCRYQTGETGTAVDIARTFLDTYSNSTWRTDVTFWLAEYAYNTGSYEQSETNFLSIVRTAPDHSLADDALYWAGRAAVRQKAFRRAIDAFTLLTRQYTNSVLIPEARFAQGDALTEVGDFAGAILAYEEIVNLYPSSPLVARALGRIGDCQFTLGSDRPARYQEALASYRAAMTHPGVSRNLALQAGYKLARAYERIGLTEEAVTQHLNVVYDWLAAREKGLPVDDVWFVRSAFAAALLRESAYAWGDAVTIYERVVESGVTAAEDARFRIDRIVNQLQKAGMGIERDTTAAP